MPSLLALILIVVGAERFIRAARTGVLTGPRLGAVRQERPVTFAVNMTILALATLAGVWLLATSLPSIYVTLSPSAR